jgi:hypothetical protein
MRIFVELLILGIFSDVEPIFHVFVSVTPLKQTLYYPSRRHREKKKHFKHRLVYLSRFSSCCQSPFYSRRYFNFRFVDVDENPGKIGSFRGTHCVRVKIFRKASQLIGGALFMKDWSKLINFPGMSSVWWKFDNLRGFRRHTIRHGSTNEFIKMFGK